MKKELSLADKEKRRDQDFTWVERLSWLMDNKFQIAGYRFGLDPILNFIPFGGAIAGFGTSLVLVMVMWRNGASSKLVVKMLINISIDAILGAIPFIGNVFDFFSKANEKNIKLMKEHYYENKHQGSAVWLVLIILTLILVFTSAALYALWLIGEWIWGLFL
ncbi:DUF4112 domain-containing protein [Sphingobacterium sp. SRCM116780]|uniref:DUF4112 domain-containing protein n=1 Tax=Sphingobacterium sp. SRCM116780 TaxID=2907623 RepID=UPI001F1B36E6|nr:DUF4112 domain-containing protein [Sphingobacterium sp. SRCM116780]UIR55706.1 DUF4112 domain-containing protein [Sphingobacterium sp. SRCM116780]